MANRVIQELNTVLNSSEAVAAFFSKSYLSAIDSINGILQPNRVIECRTIDMYYRITSFELYDSVERNTSLIEITAKSILRTAKAGGFPLSFIVLNNNGETEVFFGCNHEIAPQIKNTIIGNLHGIEVRNEWIKQDTISEMQRRNGILTGAGTLNVGDLDYLLNSLVKEDFMLSYIFFPIPEGDILTELSKCNELQDSFQKVSRTEMRIGNIRHYNNDNHQVLDTIDILNEEKAKLGQGINNGLWRTAVFISSPSREGFASTASSVSALFRGKEEIGKRYAYSARVVPINLYPYSQATWQIPVGFLGEQNLGGLYSDSLINILTLEEAASLSCLPIYSHPGYNVRHYGESAVTAGAFERYPIKQKGKITQFSLGVLETGDEFYVPFDSMRQHVFITGATQYGKSTTMRKILIESAKAGIPFIVIESAKKEYWHLKAFEGMNNVRVLSNGMDTQQFYMNPFQPESNIILDFHIQSLIQAFLSLFDSEEPLPQIISELIYLSYEKKGWDVSRRVMEQTELEYPILQDLLDNLDECINSIGYHEDVRENMRGVVRIRVSSLIRQAGRALNTRENISVEDLFKTSSIVELDDFPDRNKPFIASLIAIKINEYSKNNAIGSNLSRLLVIEEAHHIIPNTEFRSVSHNAVLCSNYFSNMLAEISAYGTGVVIIDQRPSAVASASIANTGMKIVHNLRDGEDIKRAGASLSLRNFEEQLLPKLKIGEALVVLPQTNAVCRIKINGPIEKHRKMNLGSLFCDDISPEAAMTVSTFETNYLQSNGYSVSSIVFCVKSISNKYLNKLSRTDLISVAGELVAGSSLNELQMRQLLFETVRVIDKECVCW